MFNNKIILISLLAITVSLFAMDEIEQSIQNWQKVHEAIQTGNKAQFDEFLTPDISQLLFVPDKHYPVPITLLEAAVYNKENPHTQYMIEQLIANGADPNKQFPYEAIGSFPTGNHFYLKTKTSLPLDAATFEGNVEAVRVLLEKKANPKKAIAFQQPSRLIKLLQGLYLYDPTSSLDNVSTLKAALTQGEPFKKSPATFDELDKIEQLLLEQIAKNDAADDDYYDLEFCNLQ